MITIKDLSVIKDVPAKRHRQMGFDFAAHIPLGVHGPCLGRRFVFIREQRMVDYTKKNPPKMADILKPCTCLQDNLDTPSPPEQ